MRSPPPVVLIASARRMIQSVIDSLPPDIHAAALECSVSCECITDTPPDDQDIDTDYLGLFEGYNRMDGLPADPSDMPRIRIFVDNIWESVEGIERLYLEEIKITYLHELGHYLGWDEDDVEAAGLG